VTMPTESTAQLAKRGCSVMKRLSLSCTVTFPL
jgi:hypothetical protein